MESLENTDFILQIPLNLREATNHILQILIKEVYPVILKICNKLRSASETYEVIKVREVYTLCCSQIKKCIVSLLDVLRLECHQGICLKQKKNSFKLQIGLQGVHLYVNLLLDSRKMENYIDLLINNKIANEESRKCYLERLQCCINRLRSLYIYIEKLSNNVKRCEDDSLDDSINVTIMYFVNWIDNTFELLNKLSAAIYRTDYNNNDNIYNLWKNDLVEYVSELNVSIDELLLSAMTLGRYCLPCDQHIVKARSQVVFRETKALLSELVVGDLSAPVKIKPETLRLPIMPSNVNILIDVLRNVLYVLETNTNTALLGILIYCFSNSISPIDIVKQHFINSKKGSCLCLDKNTSDLTEDCIFIKEFDLYNERLLQIGSFAVSCSSDENRTLNLRSGLASLEALDPHLVPALMVSPDSHHSELLIKSWRHEVQEIKDNVFLIVDPAAFADKSKQTLRQKLLDMSKCKDYNNTESCSIINIGCVVYDFFEVYNKYEPDAVMHHDKIQPMLADLKKVQNECKIVSNLLSSPNDFLYDVKMPINKNVTVYQLMKRLKLLYTIVNRINTTINPNQNDDHLFEAEGEMKCSDLTHTIYKDDGTYINSPKTPNYLSRTIFSRTVNILRSSKKKFPLAKLTKHLNAKKSDEISFSVQLDRIFNETNDDKMDKNKNETIVIKDRLDRIREPSILYNFSPAKRSSMRRAILNRQCISNDKLDETRLLKEVDLNADSFMDDNSLQITDVLNQINDLTNIWSTNNTSRCDLRNEPTRRNNQTNETDIKDTGRTKVLTLHINNKDTMITTKSIWNVPIPSYIEDRCLDSSELDSNISTAPSNVTSMERIYDLDLVESKLNSLKSQLETSL